MSSLDSGAGLEVLLLGCVFWINGWGLCFLCLFFAAHSIHLVLPPPPPIRVLGHLVLVRTAWGGSVLGGAGELVQLPGVDALALGLLTFWSGWSLGCPSMHLTNAILSVTIFIQVPTLQLWMPLQIQAPNHLQL